MEINQQQERQVNNPNEGRVVISQNPVRQREVLDKNGNVIDLRSKQIIRSAEQE